MPFVCITVLLYPTFKQINIKLANSSFFLCCLSLLDAVDLTSIRLQRHTLKICELRSYGCRQYALLYCSLHVAQSSRVSSRPRRRRQKFRPRTTTRMPDLPRKISTTCS